MRKTGRALVVASVAALALPLAPATALADTTSEPAAVGAYFWEQKLGSTLPGGQPNPANGQDTDADGVARDDLAVALTTQGKDESNKETFLVWDLLELASDATITKFVVTMPLSMKGPSPDPAQNTVKQRAEEAQLRACSPKGGVGATDAGSYDLRPEIDYATCVPGAFDPAAKAFVFDVTPLTTNWLTAENYGIAIIPDKPESQPPFQVVFQPTAAHLAAIEYDPGSGTDASLGSDLSLGGTDTSALSSTSSFDSSSSSTSTSSGSDSFLSSAPASSFGGSSSTGSALTPTLGGALPQTTTPEPAAAEPTVAAAQPRTAPVASRSVPGGPPLGFWVLAVALGAALLAMSLATGAPVSPVSSTGRSGRVLDRIQRLSTTRGAT